MQHQEIIIAGFGGQGILMAGKVLAYAGMLENKYVTWTASYGPEMRGGTANCHIVISEEPVGSPLISRASTLITMSGPSFEKFKDIVLDDGIIIVDSSMINLDETSLPNRKISHLPATEMASKMNNLSYANVILMGNLIKNTGIISEDSFIKALKEMLPPKKHHLLPEEIKALEAGINYKS